jgi:hypothetical protein
MPDVANAGTSAAHAAEESVTSILDVFIEYLLPLLAIVIGYFAASALGGVNAIFNLVNQAVPSMSSSAGAIAGGVMAVVYSIVAGVFWHLRSRGGIWLKAIGGFLGGFGFGAAVWAATQIWNTRAVPNGFLDTLATSIQTTVAPSTSGSGSATGT